MKARRKTLRPIKRADLSKDASAQFGDLMNLVKQNQDMFKQVLQKKVPVDEIKKTKTILKNQGQTDCRKVTKSYTIPTSARFGTIDMTVKY